MLNLQFDHTCRLTENNRIRELYRIGKKVSASFSSIYFHHNTLGKARLCISIGKKQVAKAIWRNALKRRIRESFRHRQSQLPPIDIVIVIYKTYQNFTPQQQREILNYQWQRLR